MNTNVYENTDSETITPLNKRRILPVFLPVGLYAASTAAVMSVLPFYIREMGAAVCVAVSGTVSTIGSAITLMSVSLFLLYLTGPIYWAVIQDVVHKDKVGSVGGAMHGLANISGIIGPLVTGFIVQFSGKYDYAFYLAGAIAIVSSLLVFVFVKSKGFKANESQSCVH
ncbi:MFS transporter [Salmonella enterica subsp. enterica]|nr:MFS transporter [Salmonella enterica subsp. enterica]